MTIDKLLIIDYIKEEAGEFIFDPTSNVIFSAENTAGKTCLFKSIYYAIGLDVKSFPESWDYKKMIFKAYCNFEGEKVTITRLLNSFYINDNPKSLNSKDYAAFLATKIKAHIKLPIKSNKKMMDVYPSVYILPFYIDQDDSWTDELYKDSASNMEMYVSGSIPNKIFEYLFQIENDAIISKEEELSKLKNLSTEIKSRQNVLSSLKKHFVEFPSISCALNEEDAKNEINDFLKELDKVNNSVCELKQKIYELQKKIDEDKVEISELDKIINITSNSLSGIQLRCSHCHTQLTLEQALTRMELKHNKFEIQHLKNHLSEKVSANLKELSNLRSRKLDLDEEYRKLACIINTKRNNITLQEYIEEKSKLYSSKKYSLVDDDLKEALSKNKKEIKDLNKEIKQLKAETKERKDIIENTFLDLRNSFSLSFPKANLNEYDFLTFKVKKSSGTARTEVIFSLYLCYMRLLNEYSNVKIPMGSDSIVKDEYDKKNEEIFYEKINSYFLESKNQTFFVSLEDKLSLLSKAKNKIKLKGRLLSNAKYNIIMEEFNFLSLQK